MKWKFHHHKLSTGWEIIFVRFQFYFLRNTLKKLFTNLSFHLFTIYNVLIDYKTRKLNKLNWTGKISKCIWKMWVKNIFIFPLFCEFRWKVEKNKKFLKLLEWQLKCRWGINEGLLNIGDISAFFDLKFI